MKARNIIIAAAFAVLAILSAGCKKNNFWTPTPGETIRFRMKSNMENPVETKTVSKSKSSATITGLKSGKTYYIRVRPLKTSSGTTYAGALSGYRTATAK